MSAPWEAIAAKKRAEQDALIPSAWRLSKPTLENAASLLDVRSIPLTCGLLTSAEISITSLDATSLVSILRNGPEKLSSVAVVTAFCKRAAIAQQLTNCLTEILFESALERAKYLDSEYARTGRPVGPLHGLPISLKDCFQIRGVDASLGITGLVNQPAKENSILVDLLLEAGAVLHCKTNIPQTLMALDSQNWIFGRTLNPANRKVTAGGSSGGEGTLLALRGSVLGVGTDVGGSIRIPAMCHGIYGIKPSCGRVPYGGQQSISRAGTEAVGIKSCAGPLAVSLRDCELFMKVIAESKPWERDIGVLLGGWDASGQGQIAVKGRPLIGVVRSDGLIEPLPPIKKILEETVQSLKRSGYEVVEVDMPLFKTCQSLSNRFLGIDGNNAALDLLEKTGEPLIPWLSTRVRRKPQKSLDDVVEIQARKSELEKEMLKIWKDSRGRTIDAFICPIAPHPVPPIDGYNGLSYTLSFNLLDWPCGVLPVRTFVESDMAEDMDGDGTNTWDKKNRELWSNNFDRRVYLNTSLSIQVVTPKSQERRLYQAMEIIDGAIQRQKNVKGLKL